MDAILETYRGDADAPILALRDEVLDLLRPRNLIKKMKLSSRCVVVHLQNRYGDGVVPSQVHILLDSAFSANGYSETEIGMPLASELPPGDRRTEIVQFNAQVVANSNGALPPVADDEHVIMSVAKSHSSMGIQSQGSYSREGGKLNLHKISALRPAYADAIVSSFQWDVVSWQTEEAFPLLMNLLQEAGNLVQAVCMDETRWQVALKMYGTAKRLRQTTDMSDSDIAVIVEREATRGSPRFAHELRDLNTYVHGMSGDDGALLWDLVAFFRRH